MGSTFNFSCQNEIDTHSLVGADDDKIRVRQCGDAQHFYQENISCRSVNLIRTRTGYSIELQDISSLDDHFLALGLVHAVANLTNGQILVDNKHSYSLTDFRKRYGPEWIHQHVMDDCTKAIDEASRLREGYLSIWGASREFYLGPRVARALNKIRDKKERVSEFFNSFQITQWIHNSNFYEPEILVAPKTNSTFVAWAPDTEYYFPLVDYFALISDDPDPIFVPRESIQVLAEDRCSWLDENQCIVDATSTAEWPKVVAKARKFQVHPDFVFGGRN